MYNIRDKNILQECHPLIIKRKFKQQWLTILPRPTTTIHMTSLKNTKRPRHHSLSRVVVPATLTQHLCQRSFYKIFVKFRNSKKNVLKIVLIIVNINKDETKSLISNQFSLKNDFPPHFLENYFAEVNIKKLKTITNNF
jgi:hypothetical protein